MKAGIDDVRHAYRLLLGREPDELGFSHFCDRVQSEQMSSVQLARCFLESNEFRDVWQFSLSASTSRMEPASNAPMLVCKPCTMADLDSGIFRYWATELRDRPGQPHRKLWEWSYIAQALLERGVLREGSRGLGFAVGREPLPALFASRGCSVVATDLAIDEAAKEGWNDGKQHAASIDHLNLRGICPPAAMAELVSFRTANMRAIPADIGTYDFLWSSCAMEHLGNLRHGIEFVINAMKCLRPGGIAVHTTELNCESDTRTVEKGRDVVYRKRDLLELESELSALGHRMAPLDFQLGQTAEDLYVDDPPYVGKVHLKLRIGGFASTSFGLIVKAAENSIK